VDIVSGLNPQTQLRCDRGAQDNTCIARKRKI
jgi:hypothetical protein